MLERAFNIIMGENFIIVEKHYHVESAQNYYYWRALILEYGFIKNFIYWKDSIYIGNIFIESFMNE